MLKLCEPNFVLAPNILSMTHTMAVLLVDDAKLNEKSVTCKQPYEQILYSF
jgi:hypothetical protein